MSTLGRTIAESTPAMTPLAKPVAGAPNVVVILLDDVGFAQLGPFGSGIETPAIDALASGGLRFRNYHVTAMCAPTRAAMMTGRNHHAVGMGFLPEVPIGFPGYNGRIPTGTPTMPSLLRDAGYSTFAVGKWHLTPRWEVNASGPFEHWPLGQGFERYYGFLCGDANQFAPELVCDNGFVDPPSTPSEGYHLTEDLTDRAIRFIQDQQQATPNKPFLLWYATGAQHAPHQAPTEWIEKFRGRFDQGWDAWRDEVFARQIDLGVVPAGTELPERPPWVQPWADLTEDEQRLYARMMEVYAGFLAHTDSQIQRLVDHLRDRDLLDNTLILLASDNGASGEGGPQGSVNEHLFTHDRVGDPVEALERIDELGGPRSYGHYSWGWAWAGNTPFKLWKRYTWLGGVRTPLIAHWPARILDGGLVREQFCHAIDLLPTVLEAAGVPAPTTLDGASLLGVCDDRDAPAPRSTQYFELLGSRSIYHEGWKATTDHVGAQITIEQELLEGSRSFDDDHWALYRLTDDFAEARDLSAEEPEQAQKMEALWWQEAERNQVLPLDDTFTGRAIALEPNPWPVGLVGTYHPGGGPVAEDVLPPMGAGFTLLADISLGQDTVGEGIVAALGDWNSGWSLFLAAGRVNVVFNLFGEEFLTAATDPLTPGHHELAIEFRREPEGGGPLNLFIDEAPVGSTMLSGDLPFRWQIGGAGLRIGHDVGLPVTDTYVPPFECTATIGRIQIQSHAFSPPGADTHLHRVLQHE